jgi:hypothetical protein
MPNQLSPLLRAQNDNSYDRQIMKLRFKVDQGEALRQGVDAPTSVVTLDIDPKKLTQEERSLLADRMDGIDVRELTTWGGVSAPGRSDKHVTATLATFEALMVAVRGNEDKVRPAGQVQRKDNLSNRKAK